MDVKARSKAMREILTRIREMSRGAIEIKVLGDKVILDEGDFKFIYSFLFSLTNLARGPPRCGKLASL
jgi:uncharacterized membrane protein